MTQWTLWTGIALALVGFLVLTRLPGRLSQAKVSPGRFLSVPIAAAVILIGTTQLSGQLTCGWCQEEIGGPVWVCPDPPECSEGRWEYVVGHYFPNGGDECGWPAVTEYCAACGGTSECHTEWRPDECHVECGHFFSSASEEIERAIEYDDAASMATLLITERPEVKLAIHSGVVELEGTCGDGLHQKYILPPSLYGRIIRIVAATEQMR